MEQSIPCPYTVPTIDEIVKLIDARSYGYDKSRLVSDVLECGAISISNAVDFSEAKAREERFARIMKAYDERGQGAILEIFGKIYALLSSVVYKDGVFNDYLGEIFMRSNLGDKRNGQFFTPYHTSEMMARIIIDENVVREKQRNGEILTMNDPCCGAGGLLLAGLDVMRGYGLNYARNCFIEANDIDARCAYMTYLQLSCAGAPAVVRHQDTFSRTTYSVFRTPAYMFQYPRFCKIEEEGRRGV